MKHQKRIEKRLQQFAPMIGGVDEHGGKHQWNLDEIDTRQRQHLFWILNNDEEHVAGAFVLGHVIKDLIRDDIYDIEYVGPMKDSAVRKRLVDGGLISYEWIDDSDLTKEQQDFKARFQGFLGIQNRQIEAGKKAKRERLGEYVDAG